MIIDKQELIQLLVDKTDLDEQEVRNQLAELINKIKDAAQEGKEFEIEAFGTFSMEEGMLQFTPSETLSTEINNKYSGMKPIELIGSFEGIDEEEPTVEEQQNQETDADEEGEVSVFDEAFGKKTEEKDDGFSLEGFSSTPQGGAKAEEEDKSADKEPEEEVEEPVAEDEDLQEDLVESPSASEDSEEQADVVEPDDEEAFDLAAFTGESETEEEPEPAAEERDISDESEEEEPEEKPDEQEISEPETETGEEVADEESGQEAEEPEAVPTSETADTEEDEEEKFDLDAFVGPEESEEAANKEKAEEPEEQHEDVAEDKEKQPEPSEDIDYLQHGLQGTPASDEESAVPEASETGEVAEDEELDGDVVEAGIDQEEELVAEELEEEDDSEPLLDKEPPPAADKTDGEKPIERILAVAVIVIVIVLVGLKVYDLGLLGNKSADSTSTISEVLAEQQQMPNQQQDEAPANQQPMDQQDQPTGEQQQETSSSEQKEQMADEAGTPTSEAGDTDSGEGIDQTTEPDQPEEVQTDDTPQPEEAGEPQQTSQNTYGLHGQVNSSITNGYTIVIHSFRNNGTATNKQQEFRDQGFRALVRQATVNGTTYYRVALGQFETLTAAKNAVSDLPEQYHGNNFIQQL